MDLKIISPAWRTVLAIVLTTVLPTGVMPFFSGMENLFHSGNHSGHHHSPYPQAFPCPVSLDHYPSTSVHKLRPEDIGMVGSLGDSLTAGTGAAATNVLEVNNENRGISFGTGGEETWRTNPSVANILRNFNPNIQGASYGNTLVFMVPFKDNRRPGIKGLNLSESGAKAMDMPHMAKILVRKVQSIPGWEKKWKLFTILIGHNDLCSHSCNSTIKRLGLRPYYDTRVPTYAKNLERALDILKSGLPRTYIALLGMADVTMIMDLVNKPKICNLTHFVGCPCLFEKQFQGSRPRIQGLVHAYRNEMRRLAELPKFNTDDFVVEYQPSITGDIPREYMDCQYVLDLDLLAPDCFHFMRNLHGILGRNIYNNLLQPVGQKTTDYRMNGPFECPSEYRPYLATKFNSGP